MGYKSCECKVELSIPKTGNNFLYILRNVREDIATYNRKREQYERFCLSCINNYTSYKCFNAFSYCKLLLKFSIRFSSVLRNTKNIIFVRW